MRKHLHIILFSLVILSACEPDHPPRERASRSTSAPTEIAGLTAQKKFFVSVTSTPSPIPFQELFALDVQIYDAQKHPLDEVSIDDVRAIMPAHNHGMNVKPEVEALGGGKFHIDGMRFHMRGDGDDGLWVLELLINHQGTLDTTSFEIQCCDAPKTP